MSYKKTDLLYEGKAKKVFAVQGHPDLLILEYKNSLTAFNAQKKGSFDDKGRINRTISDLIFQYLEKQGIATHRVEIMDDTHVVCKKLQMIMLEVVVRNRIAGSLAKKFGRPEGEKLPEPLVEFYYKSDELGDPFVSDDQALMLRTVQNRSELEELKKVGLQINHHLLQYFGKAKMDLIDFKIELGRDGNSALVLGDEISPDCCRLWDQATGEKMDKDRFRRDLGNVAESYNEVLARLQTAWGK